MVWIPNWLTIRRNNFQRQNFKILSLCENQYQNTSKACKSTICRLFFFPRYAKMFNKSQFVGEQFGEQLEAEKSAHRISRNVLFMNLFTT